MLISGYPNSTITEPEYYISQLVTVFVGYPELLVSSACAPAGIPVQHAKFLPTIGEVKAYLDRAAVKAAVLEKLERPRVAKPYEPPPLREGEISYPQFLQGVVDGKLKPRPVGRFETLQERKELAPEVVEEARKRLIAEYGREIFDAVPDAKPVSF